MTSISPKMGIANAPQDACCHMANKMTEDIDKAAVCNAVCHYEPSDVAFCQITLALVTTTIIIIVLPAVE